MLACFDPNYRSEQPVHPARAFQGVEQVRKNWSGLFEAVPDVKWDVIRMVGDEDTVWMEARLTGTQPDGAKLDEIGVVIFGIEEGRIAWAHLYVEEIEHDDEDIDAAVRRMKGER
jgi:predicted ester cyclase